MNYSEKNIKKEVKKMGHIHDLNDKRNIEIDNVGICQYKLPMIFKSQAEYSIIADIIAGVSLKSNVKGAHLSRIVDVLDEMIANKILSISDLNSVLSELAKRLEIANVNLSLSFEMVYPKITPISNRITYLNTAIVLNGTLNNYVVEKNISFTVQGAMLCPNSKAISKYGAHSQKCNLKATLYGKIDNLIIEEALKIASSQFSAEVYGIVKSTDEKMLTEKAYDNPKFSEDLVRDVLIELKKYYDGGMIGVEIENLESIHQHNVYARGMLR